MLVLHLQEHGEGGTHAHVLRVAGVDAGDDGLRDALQGFPAEAAAHEVAQALVQDLPGGTLQAEGRGAAARQHEVEAHARLAGPAHEPAERERHHARGDHEDDALGQLVQTPTGVDEALADVLVAVEEPVGDAELAGGRDRPGLLDDGRVRPTLDDEPVAALRVHLAAEARILLEQTPVEGRVLRARRFEDARRPKAGHAAAHDDDAARPPSGAPVARRGRIAHVVIRRRAGSPPCPPESPAAPPDGR
ncbi:MAG: hypothetical protein BWY94_02121 [Actinobacteria bacterium ADurb.BinA094]|nr:MAG: hypothetical protein BWY94_02121 [Actinobacteria bacterium ADurb.BinA094]